MKVYIVTHIDWEDNSAVAVFLSEEKALAETNRLNELADRAQFWWNNVRKYGDETPEEFREVSVAGTYEVCEYDVEDAE